jgi:Flp pilus assembly protein CpaB
VKRSNRLVILVGVLLAVLAFVGIVVLLGQPKEEAAKKQTVDVLVAKQDIAIGDSVTPDLVEVKAVEPTAVSGTRIADPSQLTGTPALFPVAKGAQVNQEAVGLGAAASSVCIAQCLEPGEKAIAFQVERVTGLDFLIQKGDHIDIIFRGEVQVLQPTADSATTGTPRFEPITGLENAPTVKTLLQNKRVLYVSATRVKPAADAAATPAPGSTGKAEVPIETVIVVFAGTDSDAEVIKFAQNDQSIRGPLTAVIRGTEDTVVEDTTGVTFKILVERFGIPIPDIIQIELPPAP